MKHLKKVFIGLLLCLGLFSPVNALAKEQINNFDIKIEVEENGVYHVRQIVDWDFGDEQHHGIYATIPQVYEMNFNGSVKRYYFPVQNINVKDYPYEVESDNSVSIQIGDPDKYVSGVVRYEYTYDIITRELGLDGRSMFYFNLVGNGWKAPIKHVNYEITMPKAFNTLPVFYGASDASLRGEPEDVNYKIDGNTIKGTYDQEIRRGRALTIQLDLENGYFAFPNYTSTQFTISGIIALLTAAIAALFFKYGKDDQVIPVVTFYPPEGLSSLQVGYAVDNLVQGKDISSLFVYWASKGYLTIEEKDDQKEYIFHKVKEIDADQAVVEKALFDGLFFEGDDVDSKELPQAFFDARLLCMTDTGNYFSGKKALKVKTGNNFQVITGLLLAIGVGSYIAINVYHYYYGMFEAVIGFIVGVVGVGILLLMYYMAFKDRRIKKNSTNLMLTIAAILVFIALSSALLLFMGWINVNLISTYIVIIALIIGCAFVIFMDKRTDYGNKLYGQLLGFREFILQAKKDKLEALVEQNPTYFYDVLPYAYVLNVSDKWIKNFEGIEMQQPDWYVSQYPMNNLLFYAALNNSMNNINAATTFSANTDATGSGGFFGGSGGGGFSGGGFGGGGGGSW